MCNLQMEDSGLSKWVDNSYDHQGTMPYCRIQGKKDGVSSTHDLFYIYHLRSHENGLNQWEKTLLFTSFLIGWDTTFIIPEQHEDNHLLLIVL